MSMVAGACLLAWGTKQVTCQLFNTPLLPGAMMAASIKKGSPNSAIQEQRHRLTYCVTL
ncbi:hypothetical protein D3C81_545090 [compost metagenome]